MAKLVIAQKKPYHYTATKSEKVAWCSCGKSAKQPFCDGSHKGGDFRPVILDVEEGKSYAFWGARNRTMGRYATEPIKTCRIARRRTDWRV
ncbi:MAG TPA: CDGSH iron-sulfur domain-containing protein [Nitrospinota bacterium]|jgi:CDGSH-type Zn-finger protein|nr:CDGSH iron-sulfur domain-containing protein [Nitrospinota bacterium]